MSTSHEPQIVSEPARARATIPSGQPELVMELVRREVDNLVGLRVQEAALKERARRYGDLQRMRRRLRASIKTREQEICADQRELDEIEREMETIRLPPGLKMSNE